MVVKKRRSKPRVQGPNKQSHMMPDGKSTKRAHYELLFVHGDMLLKDLAKEYNPDDPDAPKWSSLTKWASADKWKFKRANYRAIASHKPELLTELEAQIVQVTEAYEAAHPDKPLPQLPPAKESESSFSPEDLPERFEVEPKEPLKHYSDNFGDRLKPFYKDSLKDLEQLSLERDIAVADMMLADVSSQMELGGSVEDWTAARAEYTQLRLAVAAMGQGDPSGQPRFNVAMKNLSRLFSTRNNSEVGKLLAYWQEHKRRLISTETSRIEKAENYLNVNDAMRMASDKLSVILQVIRDEGNADLCLRVLEAVQSVS